VLKAEALGAVLTEEWEKGEEGGGEAGKGKERKERKG
jgi:hypothetical protein